MIKKFVIGFSGLLLLLVGLASAGIYWASGFSPSQTDLEQLRSTQPDEIAYLRNAILFNRGKILAVVTSTRTLGDTGKQTGYELTELARAYWVFTANGFAVDIASPDGGEPYALLDEEDMGSYDYAFLNDPAARQKTQNTIRLSDISADDYRAIYFVGGKGAMFDFPDNPAIQNLVASFARDGKVIAAVCHGPAALINVKGPDGEWLVADKPVSAFTDSEELLLIPDAENIFPYLLQKKLQERGANFIAGPDYLQQVSVTEGLVTGQNPWSVWRLAEETIRQLGYEPQRRTATPEENTVVLLEVYHKQGLEAAEKFVRNNKQDYYSHLVLMHSIVAFLKWNLFDGAGLIILADSLRES